jgi:hypothetical protein
MKYATQTFIDTKKINSEMIDFISCADHTAIENTPEWDKLKDIFFMMKLSELQQENIKLKKRIDSIIKILN